MCACALGSQTFSTLQEAACCFFAASPGIVHQEHKDLGLVEQ